MSIPQIYSAVTGSRDTFPLFELTSRNMDKEALAVYQRYWYQRLWNYCGDIPGLTPILDILEQGPVDDETLFEFKGRFQGLAYDYKDQLKDVVGGVQEEREPGDDPGDDEDRLV
jgi:hypothetical protein